MITLLARWFIPNRENTADPAVRRAYGTLCGAVGIVLNLLLAAGKFLAGTLAGSIAVTADAFNNLSDAGSSLITLLGFRLAGRRADAGHPYGHGRLEYVSGLAVAVVIILMAFELGKSAVGKILAPEPVSGGWLPAAILAAAIGVKLYMFCYNRAVAKRIGSAAMRAAAADSLSDCIATAVVLLSMGVSRLFAVNIDGWAGLAVALFILWTGIGAARDTLSPLLGQAPSPEFVREVTDTVLAHPEVLGIHDLIVHDYGPGRQIISLHAEVDGKKDIFATHDAIDNIERELRARCARKNARSRRDHPRFPRRARAEPHEPHLRRRHPPPSRSQRRRGRGGTARPCCRAAPRLLRRCDRGRGFYLKKHPLLFRRTPP